VEVEERLGLWDVTEGSRHVDLGFDEFFLKLVRVVVWLRESGIDMLGFNRAAPTPLNATKT